MNIHQAIRIFPAFAAHASGPIAKNATVILAMRIFNMAAGFCIALILANALGASNYGVFAFCLSVASAIAVFSRLALPSILVRIISSSLALDDDRRLVGGVIFAALGTLALFGVTAFSISLLFQIKGAALLPEMQSAAGWAIIIGAFMAAAGIAQGLLRGFNAVKIAFAPEFVIVPVTLILMIAAGLLSGQLGARFAIIAALCAWSAGALISIAYAVRFIKQHFSGVRPHINWRQWSIDALSLSAMSSAVMLLGTVDVLVLGIFAPPADVGYFVFAMRLAVVSSLVGASIAGGLSPVVSRLHSTGAIDALKDRIGKAAIANTVGSILLASAVTIFAWTILPIVSPELAPAKNYVAIIALGFAVAGCAGRPFEVLAMTGKSTTILKAGAISTTLVTIFIAALIPLYGAYGAAAASAAGLISNAIIFSLFSYRQTQIRCDVFAALRQTEPKP